ncbi:MAG: DUF928 domain-containing protein, partial [Cyanobacteria bacterium P01_A01_bin.17]
ISMKFLLPGSNALPLIRVARAAVCAATAATLLLSSQGIAKEPLGKLASVYSAILDKAYNPPPRRRSGRTRAGTSGGVRGCGEPLVALAPQLHSDGQTTSRYPTLTWYNFNNSSPFTEIELYKYQPDGSLEEVFIRPVDIESSGYTSYTIPETDEGLTVGSTYLWKVVDYCDELYEEISFQVAANITVMEQDEIADSPAEGTSVEQARAYAENGIWYDALVLVYTAADAESVALRQELIMDLAGFEQDFIDENQQRFSEWQLESLSGTIERLEEVSQLP